MPKGINVKLFSIAVFSIFLLSFISANGLKIEGDLISINKTSGTSATFDLNVSNEEPITFFNITFKESEIVNLPEFSLAPGENRTVTATIVSDEDYEGALTLIGQYETTLGASNRTEEVEIDYDSGFSRCNLDLIKGDSINWINNHYDSVRLINEDTGEEILSISENSNQLKQFNTPMEFDYYATWIGFRFTEICHINVMNDNGLVHNSAYDDTLTLSLKINYNPTTIESTFLNSYYEIQFNGNTEDIFQLRNTGSQKARKIHLESDWITFDRNDFDLDVGASTNIGYTIEPAVFQTNDTDKNWTKQIAITGNFNTITKDIIVYIPYRDVNTIYNGTIDTSVIENFFKSWCKNDIDTCQALFCGVYPDACTNIAGVNKTITQEMDSTTLKGLLQGYASLLEESSKTDKTQIEADSLVTDRLNSIDERLNATENSNFQTSENMETLSTAIAFVVIFACFIIFGIFAYFIFFKEAPRNLIKKRFGFHKGER